MRMIGHIDEQAEAQAFSDFLYVQGIDNQVELEKEGVWAVWVHAEDDLSRAQGMLAEFKANPADPKYKKVASKAAKLRTHSERSDQSYRKRILDGSMLWRGVVTYGYGLVSLAVIIICGAVFFLSDFGHDMRAVHWLFIGEYISPGGIADRLMALLEIRHGQIWRLITPIFLHFSFMHLFFNMLWMLDLGSMVEMHQGKGKYLLLMAGLAIFSNVAQYLVAGPRFGGMSGVVYGLLGYVWIRGKFDPTSGLYLHPTTVAMMMIWFLICLLGLTGQVANMAHAAGLGLGMAWGYAAAWFNRR
jgi:GlpG protein